MLRSRLWLVIASLPMVGSSWANNNNRLMVAEQDDFNGNRGFYLDFENTAPDGQPCAIGTLQLYFGIADGQRWRWLNVGAAFAVGDSVKIHAEIASTSANLTVNGHAQASPGGFAPFNQILTAADLPGWANGRANYRLTERALNVTVGGTSFPFSFPSNQVSQALLLFENPLLVQERVPIDGSAVVKIDATVTIDSVIDPNPYKPLIDGYGQVRQAIYPSKILSDSGLKAAWAADDKQLAAWKPRRDTDPYGGALNIPWAEKGTGSFRAVKRNGYWWLLSPLGNPLFYTGMCNAPLAGGDMTPVTGRTDIFATLPPNSGAYTWLWGHNIWGSDNSDYVALGGVNQMKRFGANWRQSEADEAAARMKAWGFSGQGKWSAPIPQSPFLPVLYAADVKRIDRHFDVFDPQVRTDLRNSLGKQITPNVKNPYLLGYSFGNEYDEIVTPGEVSNILGNPKSSPAKLAFISYARGHIYGASEIRLRQAWKVPTRVNLATTALTAPAPDIERIRQFYASSYYNCLYTTVKSLDPNHLYFGFWIVPNWWVSEIDWSLIARNVDVIGFDRYSDWSGIEPLLARFDKPVLLGEFSFPAWYGGARGFGRYLTYAETDLDAGARYAELIKDASSSSQCVGVLYFEYRDEPYTGRGPATGSGVVMGEHYAFGFVDVADLPKYDLVSQARTANLAVNAHRLTLTK